MGRGGGYGRRRVLKRASWKRKTGGGRRSVDNDRKRDRGQESQGERAENYPEREEEAR